MDLDEWRHRGRYVKAGGHELFLMDTDPAGGRAETILFIHGFPTAGWDFHRLVPGLQADYRLVVPDMLGFGFSDKPKGHDYRIHEQADLLETVIAGLGLGPFHVMAHDYGDSVAQEMLARENAKPRTERRWLSLCLLNGGLFPETHHARLSQKLLHGPLGPVIGRLMNRGTLERNLSAVFGPQTPPSEEDLDAFWALITEKRGDPPPHPLHPRPPPAPGALGPGSARGRDSHPADQRLHGPGVRRPHGRALPGAGEPAQHRRAAADRPLPPGGGAGGGPGALPGVS